MKIDFPRYKDVPDMDVPDKNLLGVFSLPSRKPNESVIKAALENPIGTSPLGELTEGKNKVLIVCDDVARPTPACKIIPYVLKELAAAGVPESGIEFMMALGTHRPMIEREKVEKVGLNYAETPSKALDKALEILGGDAKVIVLRGAAEMLPVVG